MSKLVHRPRADTSRLRLCSILAPAAPDPLWLRPLVPNFPMELTCLRRSIRCACQFGRAKRESAGRSGAR